MTTPAFTSKSSAGYTGDDTGGVAFRWPGIADTLPTNAVDDLVGALDMGTVTDAGIAHAISRETTDKKTIAGRVYHVLQTSVDHTYTLTLGDSVDLTVLRTVVGDDNVIVDSEGRVTVRHNSKTMPRQSFVFELLLDQGIKRSVIEVGQVISVGDVVHVSSEMYEFQLTIKVFAGPSLDGDFVRDYYAFEGAAVFGVSTAMLPAGKVGEAYAHQLRVVGGKAPYTFEGENLPDGLSLSTDGELSGTPTSEGEADIVVKVTDADGAIVRKTLAFVASA